MPRFVVSVGVVEEVMEGPSAAAVKQRVESGASAYWTPGCRCEVRPVAKSASERGAPAGQVDRSAPRDYDAERILHSAVAELLP